MRIYSGAWTRRSLPMMVSRTNQGRRCWKVVALSHVDGSLCRRFMGHAWRWHNIAVGPYGTPQLLALIVAGALCDTAQCDGLHISISRPNGRRVDMPRTDAYEHNAKRYARPHPRLFLFFKSGTWRLSISSDRPYLGRNGWGVIVFRGRTGTPYLKPWSVGVRRRCVDSTHGLVCWDICADDANCNRGGRRQGHPRERIAFHVWGAPGASSRTVRSTAVACPKSH
ncbi:hypothetical protein C7412_108246 [Paraburkholderia silvatlantica]|nr:hypothetical protein C7412_108246 [Paraburkholderia silvatlantica]